MNDIAQYRKNVGNRLFKLALEWSSLGSVWSEELPYTRTRRTEIVKNMRGRKSVINGSKSVKAAVAAVEELAMLIREKRRERVKSRLPQFNGMANWSGRRIPAGRRNPDVPLDKRLMQFKEKCFRLSLSEFDVHPTHGDVYVQFTTRPEQVGVEIQREHSFDVYSRSCKYPALVVTIKFTIPLMWRTRVYKRGLAIADGMLTLDAAPLDGAPDGVELYSAVWARKGRGYDIYVERGVIAKRGDMYYHGDTVPRALAGLRRKINYVAPSREEQIDRFVKRYSKGNYMVCISDAEAVGACMYGIESWCEQNGIDINRECIPVAEACEAYRRVPMPEARAAILYARRRAMSEKMAA